jgi:hypothetical protein
MWGNFSGSIAAAVFSGSQCGRKALIVFLNIYKAFLNAPIFLSFPIFISQLYVDIRYGKSLCIETFLRDLKVSEFVHPLENCVFCLSAWKTCEQTQVEPEVVT